MEESFDSVPTDISSPSSAMAVKPAPISGAALSTPGIGKLSGSQTVIAGASRFGGDGGPAIQAKLNQPRSVAVDRNGNVFVADSGNFRIRKVDQDGMISTIAGTGETKYSQKSGLAVGPNFRQYRGNCAGQHDSPDFEFSYRPDVQLGR